MEDLVKSTEDIKNYLKKLLRIIEYEAVFSLGNSRFVDKTKIDDAICCIDVSFPTKYKEMIKYLPQKEGKTTNTAYTKLKTLVQNRFFFNKNYYYIKNIFFVKECIKIINSNINNDFSFVYKSN